jgi:RNA polymerase sigma-70 factor (ECF subfamily)
MDFATDDRADPFRQHRPLLFSIAYRMLGSASDAEDVVQDAYLRWRRVNPLDVRSPKDFLSTTVTRLAMDHLRSARARREVYVGPWLPEPLVGVDERDPIANVQIAESLSLAFLVLLERLTPTQRAAFLLREVFDYEYSEIAPILEKSEANCRQLVQRAKQRLEAGTPRFEPNTAAADDLTRRFLDACTTGEMDGLLALLANEAVAWADGGGKFSAARRPVVGANRVARFVTGVLGKWRSVGEVVVAPVNGGVGLLHRVAGRLRGVMTVSTNAGRIQSVFIMVNPEKLRATPRPLDAP